MNNIRYPLLGRSPLDGNERKTLEAEPASAKKTPPNCRYRVLSFISVLGGTGEIILIKKWFLFVCNRAHHISHPIWFRSANKRCPLHTVQCSTTREMSIRLILQSYNVASEWVMDERRGCGGGGGGAPANNSWLKHGKWTFLRRRSSSPNFWPFDLAGHILIPCMRSTKSRRFICCYAKKSVFVAGFHRRFACNAMNFMFSWHDGEKQREKTSTSSCTAGGHFPTWIFYLFDPFSVGKTVNCWSFCEHVNKNVTWNDNSATTAHTHKVRFIL